jgi:ribosome-associated protein
VCRRRLYGELPPADRGYHYGQDGQGRRVTEIVESDIVARSRIAARAADAKKGDDIVILDVGQIMGIVESFVITSAPNSRLVRAIVDEVEHEIFERTGDKPRAVEGLRDASWVLLDYGDLVVHVFFDETRRFYDIERLYRDVPVIDWRRAGVR